jgi:hypothetical protein
MSDQPLGPTLPSSPPSVARVRVEYLGFRTVDEQREFRLRVYDSARSSEFKFRIALAAFGAARVRLQDGPDVCYQRLLHTVAAGEAASPDALMRDVITIDEADLVSYREAHTHVPKRRSWTSAPAETPAAPAPLVFPRKARTPRPLPVALVATEATPALAAGQRVSHAVYGVGVTASSSGGHTVVRFDQDGPKTFVTSMLEVEVLSAPHTWETTARGNNRPCHETRSPSALPLEPLPELAGVQGPDGAAPGESPHS